MVTGVCHFRGNCPYVVTEAFIIMEGSEKCMDCYYFVNKPQKLSGETYPTKRAKDKFLFALNSTNTKSEPVSVKTEEDYSGSDFDSPDFLEIC